MSNLKSIVYAILIPLIIGAISALVSMGAMKQFALLTKPPLSPPGWLFPIVWTILYILMGVASYLISKSDNPRDQINKAISFYAVQLAFNFLWSIIFFNLESYLFALIWLFVLIILIVYTTILFYDIDKKAAYLMIPYILWCMFALYLNAGIYVLN